MTFVLLQSPSSKVVYRWLVKATCDKHFELLDAGWREIESGDYYHLRELDKLLSWPDLKDCIWLRKPSGQYWYTTEDCLSSLIDQVPDMIDNDEFVDMTLELFMEKY